MNRKKTLPVIFGVLMVLVLIAYGIVYMVMPIPFPVKLLIGLPVLGMSAALVYLVFERNKEIDEEEKDDLGKY